MAKAATHHRLRSFINYGTPYRWWTFRLRFSLTSDEFRTVDAGDSKPGCHVRYDRNMSVEHRGGYPVERDIRCYPRQNKFATEAATPGGFS